MVGGTAGKRLDRSAGRTWQAPSAVCGRTQWYLVPPSDSPELALYVHCVMEGQLIADWCRDVDFSERGTERLTKTLSKFSGNYYCFTMKTVFYMNVIIVKSIEIAMKAFIIKRLQKNH